MMDSMPKDMMQKCQEMMKDSGMMNGGMKQDGMSGSKSDTKQPKASDTEHNEHHPEN